MDLNTILVIVAYVAVFAAIFYFIIYRPQKKRDKQAQAIMDSMAIGDSVLTTAGFYGVIIDIMDDVIIVEFGSNKNCRIPMQKSAIVQLDKGSKE